MKKFTHLNHENFQSSKTGKSLNDYYSKTASREQSQQTSFKNGNVFIVDWQMSNSTFDAKKKPKFESVD